MLNREGRVQRLRRGLNDELDCNACGLYCKLVPTPAQDAGGGAECRRQSVRAEAGDVMGRGNVAQCYNCHTTAAPLWRKDDEGKTVFNAYLALTLRFHSSARPISMKSAIIRKLSRHDARHGGASASVSERPTAIPHASPAPKAAAFAVSTSAGRASPTLAPDSTTTTHTYDMSSELSSALGPKPPYWHLYRHEQYPDALPFASVDVRSDVLEGGNGAAQQQQYANVDSANEPPSNAVS
ncbi:hypothetical protein K438DRAFT_1602942 [Mycena galopus ATCC 62051]|nr:hypothetical protein K438DRAFT_1602942 [Mycena galopus ATCC 62051]